MTRFTAMVALLAGMSLLVFTGTAPAAPTSSTINAIGSSGASLTGLTIDGTPVGLDELIGVTVNFHVGMRTYSAGTGTAAAATQAIAAARASDGFFNTGYGNLATPYTVTFNQPFVTDALVDFVLLAQGPQSATLSPITFTPLDLLGNPIAAEQITLGFTSLTGMGLSTNTYTNYSITGVDSGTGWATSFVNNLNRSATDGFAVNFSSGLAISGVQIQHSVDFAHNVYLVYGVNPIPEPASVMLLAMSGGLLLCRRRQQVN